MYECLKIFVTIKGHLILKKKLGKREREIIASVHPSALTLTLGTPAPLPSVSSPGPNQRISTWSPAVLDQPPNHAFPSQPIWAPKDHPV